MVVIYGDRLALLAVDNHAALLAAHGSKAAISIPAQQESAARVVSRRLGPRVERILAEESILAAIAIEVRDAHAECGRHLCFNWQCPGFETQAAIQKNC